MSARGLFVGYRNHLQGAGGGVQVCTQEYMRVIEAAGVDLTVIPFDIDRRLSTRVRRQANTSPYFRPFGPDLVERLDAALGDPPEFVFLNQVAISGLASIIRPRLPSGSRIIVLSHGAEIVDLLHAQRLRRHLPLTARFRPTATTAMGKVLADESASRRDVDLVISLSPFDAEMETWFGRHDSTWLPRTIQASPLDSKPVGARFGFVGTLDHAPNLEGLVLALEAMKNAAPEAQVRVVGGSRKTSGWLAKRFPSVEYLGPLDDPALVAEAATWNGFLHPIFCAARGCSTKLAKAIEWQIPILTTPQGRRGYIWSDGALIEANSPREFALGCRSLLEPKARAEAVRGVTRVAASSPTLVSVASQMRKAIGLPEAAHTQSQFTGDRSS